MHTCRLVCRGQLLDGHVSSTRSALRHILAQRGVVLVEHDPVTEVRPDRSLSLASGRSLPPQGEVLWCTQAGAGGWLAGSGLPTDAEGFLAVDACLRSDGGPPEVLGNALWGGGIRAVLDNAR